MSEQDVSTAPAIDVASLSPQQLAARIANGLGELQRVPRGQIARVVRILGAPAALAFYEQAQAIEAAGGEMLPDGSRGRTVGGIFFRLVRKSVPRKVRLQIFPGPRGKQPAATDQGEPPAPAPGNGASGIAQHSAT